MGCSTCPPLPKLAVNAAAAGARVVSAAVNGLPVFASKAEREKRSAICLDCPECVPWENNPKIHRCQKCGCFLDAKYLKKWSLATERCPIGKWGIV